MYAALLATLCLYWPGLKGPFVLDDLPNLSPLQQAIEGQAPARELIFGNQSGVLGRPLSMATLWFSAVTGGMHPFPFKIGNLIIHLLCGLVGWQLLYQLLKSDPRLAGRAGFTAAVLAALWLLHPINVSTVLYAVQRMAQLSTLFVLASVWAYVSARRSMIDGDTRAANVRLFLLFPILVAAGLMSKENAAIAPALCLLVEVAYFLREPRKGKSLAAFFLIFLLVPVVLATTLLVLMPESLLNYEQRDFTLYERLLTQPRALVAYLSLMLWPRGGPMGVFVDDFTLSTGWLEPLSTAACALTLLAISAMAIAMRQRSPSIFAGWFFFLLAHAVESSIFPLELYFEHRNYLPLFGVLLAVAGALSLLTGTASRFQSQSRLRTVMLSLIAMTAIALSAITWKQVQVWRSIETITEQALEHHPESARAKLEMMTIAADSGRWDEAFAMAESLMESPHPRHRLIGNLHAITIECLSGRGGEPSHLTEAEAVGIQSITLAEVLATSQLSRALDEGRCGSKLDHATVGAALVRILDGTSQQSDQSRPKWLLRAAASRLYMNAGEWAEAEKHAELAWQPTTDTGFGALLIYIYIHNAKKHKADTVWHEVKSRVQPYELVAQQELQRLRTEIDALPSNGD